LYFFYFFKPKNNHKKLKFGGRDKCLPLPPRRHKCYSRNNRTLLQKVQKIATAAKTAEINKVKISKGEIASSHAK